MTKVYRAFGEPAMFATKEVQQAIICFYGLLTAVVRLDMWGENVVELVLSEVEKEPGLDYRRELKALLTAIHASYQQEK